MARRVDALDPGNVHRSAVVGRNADDVIATGLAEPERLRHSQWPVGELRGWSDELQ
jgi:hypothetical protein